MVCSIKCIVDICGGVVVVIIVVVVVVEFGLNSDVVVCWFVVVCVCYVVC